ncbi:MAG: helix-turn-helix domain-containing protein [Lachnospiraceae bacterium]|nr:helix-turn-helix domain-containing protein [Lachnospiraceae bacterium]
MKELRKILRELREDHDLKQETVANYLGIEQQSYSNYENGNRGIPVWVVIKLSDYYKVSTDYLLSAGSNCFDNPNLRNAYLNNITMHDVLYDIQKLDPDNRKDLLRYLNYLKYISQ